MKTFPLFVLVLVFVVAAIPDAHAKKGRPKDAAPAAATPADASNPVAALSPYIINLDGLLALNRTAKSTQAFASEAPGKLLVLRQEFVVEREKAADDKKSMFDAAIKTSDLIGAALEERGKVLGDLSSSHTVASDGKLQEPSKKDNLTQGIHGDGLAKAVGSVVERDRERQSIAKGQAQHAANDNALSAMASNQWNKRAGQWHDQIAAAYSQIK